MQELKNWKILSANKFYYLSGGSETYLFALEDLLRSRGAEVVSFAMKDERNRPSPHKEYFLEKKEYLKGSVWTKIVNGISMIYSPHARRKLSKLLDDHPVHIAHLHNTYYHLTPSIFYELKKRGIPIVYTVHDLKPCCPVYTMMAGNDVCERCRGGKYYHCLLGRCTKGSLLGSLLNMVESYVHRLLRVYDMVDLFIAPSRFYRSKMIEFGFAEDKVVHLDYTIDVDAVAPVYENKGYALCMGRLAPEKGLFTLLEAAEKVPNQTLHILGTGPLEERIKRFVDEHNLDHVKLLGFQSGEDLNNQIRGAKAVVIPSEWYENSPLTLYEAFTYGKPVIASSIGGLPEYIEDNVTGHTFPPKNVEKLAEILGRKLDDEKNLQKMGRIARQKAIEWFHPDYHFEQISGIYRKLASAREMKVPG